MFKWFKNRTKSLDKTPENKSNSDVIERIRVEPGRPPEKIINRINQIKWNDWNQPTSGTVFFRSLGLSGVTFNNSDGVSRQEILARMQRWEALDLVREPSNPHDKNAVAVYSGMGQIGYVEKAWCDRVALMMDSGWFPLAKLSAIYGGEAKNYGGKMEIHLSPPDAAVALRAKVVNVRGRNTNGDSRRELVEDIKGGEMVELSLGDDYDDDRNHVYVDLEFEGNIGRLDKKNADILAPLLEEGYSYIASLEEVEFDDDDNPKLAITITAWQPD